METNVKLLKQLAWTLSMAGAEGKLNSPAEFAWNLPTGKDYYDIKKGTHGIYVSGDAIRDMEVHQFIQGVDVSKYLNDISVANRFEQKFHQWIAQGNGYYKLKGFDEFEHVQFTNGSQDAFTHFYLRNRNRRFRVLQGEYWYHMETMDRLGLEWQYLYSPYDPIDKNDVILLSVPFAKNADIRRRVIEDAETAGAQILIDMIYLPNFMRHDEIDLSSPAIQELTFSLSKTFPLQCARIGIRMNRTPPSDGMRVTYEENVNNRFSAGLALEVIENFPVDFMVNKYQPMQEYWCNKLGLDFQGILQFGAGKQIFFNKTFSKYNDHLSRYNLRLLYENHEWLHKITP